MGWLDWLVGFSHGIFSKVKGTFRGWMFKDKQIGGIFIFLRRKLFGWEMICDVQLDLIFLFSRWIFWPVIYGAFEM